MLKKALVAGLLVLAGAGLAVGWFFWGGETVVSLNQWEIQQAIVLGFPVEKTYLGVLKVHLRDPLVVLPEASDRIGLRVTVDAGIPGLGKPSTGTAELSCRIRYDREKVSFYADDPRVERLSLDEHRDGAPEKAPAAVTWIVKGLLADRPLYTLTSVDVGHSLAKLVLKDVRVKDGKLRLTLAVDRGPSTGP
jgi:hypothetical protein